MNHRAPLPPHLAVPACTLWLEGLRDLTERFFFSPSSTTIGNLITSRRRGFIQALRRAVGVRPRRNTISCILAGGWRAFSTSHNVRWSTLAGWRLEQHAAWQPEWQRHADECDDLPVIYHLWPHLEKLWINIDPQLGGICLEASFWEVSLIGHLIPVVECSIEQSQLIISGKRADDPREADSGTGRCSRAAIPSGLNRGSPPGLSCFPRRGASEGEREMRAIPLTCIINTNTQTEREKRDFWWQRTFHPSLLRTLHLNFMNLLL